MPPSWVSPIAGIVGSQVVGRGLGMVVGTGPVGRLIGWADGRELTPFEHRVITSRWMGDFGGGLAELAVETTNLLGVVAARKNAGSTAMTGSKAEETDWVDVLQRVATILVALGAILKVVAGIIGDRDRTANETASWRASQIGRAHV